MFPYFLYYLSKFKDYEFYDIFDIHTQERNFEDNKEIFDEFLNWFCQPESDEKNIDDEFEMSSVKSLIRRRKIEQEMLEDAFD